MTSELVQQSGSGLVASKHPQSRLDEVLRMANVFAKSGVFQDARDLAVAAVKILAGEEMGFGPIASMSGFHILPGKPPSMGAHLMAAKIRREGYDYRVREHTPKICTIEYFFGGESLGLSSFSMDDAKIANLLGEKKDKFGNEANMYRKVPRNMLWSRAMSNGCRWYCAGAFGGVTPYTPEELGADINEQGEPRMQSTATITQADDLTAQILESEKPLDQGGTREAVQEQLPDWDAIDAAAKEKIRLEALK